MSTETPRTREPRTDEVFLASMNPVVDTGVALERMESHARQLERENQWLRKSICLSTAGVHGYYDDGEFQDNRFPAIDWRRDSIDDIKAKIERRNLEAISTTKQQ